MIICKILDPFFIINNRYKAQNQIIMKVDIKIIVKELHAFNKE